MVIFDTDIRNG